MFVCAFDIGSPYACTANDASRTCSQLQTTLLTSTRCLKSFNGNKLCVLAQMNLGCSHLKGCVTVAYDLVTLTSAAHHLLHNLLHKRSTGRHTLSCTVHVISAFSRAYYSTARSVMSLWLQNHTSHLSPFFFCVSSKNWLPVFIAFSFSLRRCRNPGGHAKNKPKVWLREIALC